MLPDRKALTTAREARWIGTSHIATGMKPMMSSVSSG
jgi:hypothetical protein